MLKTIVPKAAFVAAVVHDHLIGKIDALSAFLIAGEKDGTRKSKLDFIIYCLEKDYDWYEAWLKTADTENFPFHGRMLYPEYLNPYNVLDKSLILKGIGRMNGDGWKDTTKVGDVVFAWNDEMPKPYTPGQYTRVHCTGWTAGTDQYNFQPATLAEVKAFLDETFHELRDLRSKQRQTVGNTAAALNITG